MGMEKEINIRKELEKTRKAVKDLPRTGNGDTIEAYWNVCCGDVLLAEENMRNQSREWENSSLAKEFLDIAEYLEGFDHKLDGLQAAAGRMADAVFDHPSLKLRIFKYRLLVLRRIECLHDCELSTTEDLESIIHFYERNIERADNGEFDSIEQEGILKRDPVEWSAEYERVIDDAGRRIDELLKGHPRGMGFCHEYWQTKEYVLRTEFGIDWRSPAAMNPGTMFD